MKIIELKDGGATIPVTQESKREFVQLSAQYRLYSSIKEQIEAMSTGFYEIIPKELVNIVSLCLSCACDVNSNLVIVRRKGAGAAHFWYP